MDALPGQTVAIVGPTGAGKTTIINLIPRFYDALDGTVKIDGIDVRDVTLSSLRKQVGIVLQDSFLFSDTVMNNIRYGHPEATDDEVMAAAKLARADTFIQGSLRRLPDHPGRAGRRPEPGPAPAALHRPGGPGRPPHPDSGRGHQQRGHPHREADSGSAGTNC